MAKIRPSSDLCNSYNKISEYCHTYNEPVYIEWKRYESWIQQFVCCPRLDLKFT